ncbi:MAG: hypothetical protein LQ351_005085 [Letrouitia transgressa]|nr:MAG: hypothetical protein LQ351_005085 [Letrouitia transgressa]
MSTPLPSPDSDPTPSPSPIRWVLGFLLVGLAWGLTTPFIRRAAIDFHPPPHSSLEKISANPPPTSSPAPTNSERIAWGSWWLKKKIVAGFWTVIDLLRSPKYAIPLVINLTGSVWFFLLIGKAELSLTIPITNSLAFLFTVLGEWWAEGKMISRDTWIGMFCVLGGIALCVQSKNG